MYFRPLLLSMLSLAAACGLPRDPEGTLDRVRGGTLRVGFVVDTPWVAEAGQGAGGIEGAIASELARGLGARIAWTHASETPLLGALHDGDLDLVIAGLTKDSPWAAKASFTRPFERDKKLLQREQKAGVPGFLTLAAYLAVLAIWSGMVAVCAWALARLARTRREDSEPRPRTGRFDRTTGDLSPQSDPALSATRK